MMHSSTRGSHQGFTLIELMITIFIAALIMSFAVPGFRSVIQNNRLTTQINTLVSDLHLARSEAVKSGMPTTLCKRNAGATACDGSASWESGWLIFVDADGDGVVDGADGDRIVRVRDALSDAPSLVKTGNRITFDSRGSSAGFNGTFTLCDNRGAGHAVGIVLANTGRLRLATDSDGDGVREAGSGADLSCS